MVWVTLPNRLLYYIVIKGKFNLKAYIELLRKDTVPILKLNFGAEIWVQEDNFDFIIMILSWSTNSPDLSIAEDISKLISDQVYGSSQFHNINDLTAKPKHVVGYFNQCQRRKIMNLYKSY